MADLVHAECSKCNNRDGSRPWTWTGPERAWEWISDRHAHDHRKGVGGISAGSDLKVTRIRIAECDAQVEAGQ